MQIRITAAQRNAASQLPFLLSEYEIAAQFNPDGTSVESDHGSPMKRVRNLARSAINDAVNRQLKAA